MGHLRLATMMGEDWHGLDSIGPGFFHFFLKSSEVEAEGSEGSEESQLRSASFNVALGTWI